MFDLYINDDILSFDSIQDIQNYLYINGFNGTKKVLIFQDDKIIDEIYHDEILNVTV